MLVLFVKQESRYSHSDGDEPKKKPQNTAEETGSHSRMEREKVREKIRGRRKEKVEHVKITKCARQRKEKSRYQGN